MIRVKADSILQQIEVHVNYQISRKAKRNENCGIGIDPITSIMPINSTIQNNYTEKQILTKKLKRTSLLAQLRYRRSLLSEQVDFKNKKECLGNDFIKNKLGMTPPVGHKLFLPHTKLTCVNLSKIFS